MSSELPRNTGVRWWSDVGWTFRMLCFPSLDFPPAWSKM